MQTSCRFWGLTFNLFENDHEQDSDFIILMQSALVVRTSTVAAFVAHHYKPTSCLTPEATDEIGAAHPSL